MVSPGFQSLVTGSLSDNAVQVREGRVVVVQLSESVAVGSKLAEFWGQTGPDIFPVSSRDGFVRGPVNNICEGLHARSGRERVTGSREKALRFGPESVPVRQSEVRIRFPTPGGGAVVVKGDGDRNMVVFKLGMSPPGSVGSEVGRD